MQNPRSTTPGSVMPRYTHLFTWDIDVASIGPKMRALRTVGVPYTDGEIDTAPASIEAQAKAIAAEVEAQQGPRGLAGTEIMALTAYLQRLGTDIKWQRVAPQPLVVPPAAPPPPSVSTPPAATGGKPATTAVPVALAPAPAGGKK